jgi:hypothetical protein
LAVVLATPRYVASVLERKTTAWHLEDQDTRELPRKTQKPVVERRVLRHPAQSASA